MKPIYTKSTFWRRIPSYHRAILFAALSTAFRSGRTFENFPDRDEIFDGAKFDASGETAAHPFWLEAFRDNRNSIEQVLEIGAFEGQTTLFIAWLFPNARITCVDPWQDYNEVTEGMASVGEAFAVNTRPFTDRIDAIRGFSSVELPKLLETGKSFDLIFVDGSHSYSDVMLDSQLSWRLLKLGGVLIWDDYLWRRKEYGKRVPKLAIDQFLSAFRGLYHPLWAFKQVAIRKHGSA